MITDTARETPGHGLVAVIGLSCRFPGGADSPELFWQLLREGRDAIGPVPADRWDMAAYYDPDPAAPGKSCAREGGFLRQPVADFDAAFFRLTAREAVSMDPQHRLLLEMAWEAFADAGLDIARFQGSPTAVYVGISSDDYQQAHMQSGDPGRIDAHSLPGVMLSSAAGRISGLFGFEGPCLAVDTACSSALAAVHLACRALRSREADLALAAGVNCILTPLPFIFFTKLGVISPDARCKSFDAAADGFARGEGGGAVLLKRLPDALRDGDPVAAVIRGSALSQEGRSGALTAPGGPAQARVLRRALADAGLSPLDIDWVETHGTGTRLGDPAEVEALGEVFAPGRPVGRPLLLGAVKTNIGHLEAASGMAGLIKAILCLRHGEVPGNLHFRNPTPRVDWAALPFHVPVRAFAWPRGGAPRRAGVSAFGFGGTDAHVVLEEAPERPGAETVRSPLPPPEYRRHTFWLAPVFDRRPAGLGPAGSPAHPLLGEREAAPDGEARFLARLGLDRLPLLRGHRLRGRCVFPAAGFLEMARAAGETLLPAGFRIEDGHFAAFLELPENREVEVRSLLTAETAEAGAGAWRMEILSRAEPSGAWGLNARFRLREGPGPEPACLDPARLGEDFPETGVTESLRRRLQEAGFQCEEPFGGLREVRAGPGGVLGLTAPAEAGTGQLFPFHPALLDACLQLGAVLAGPVPAGFRSCGFWRPGPGPWRVVFRPEGGPASDRAAGELQAFAENGAPVLEIRGLRCRPLPSHCFQDPESLLYHVSWRECPRPAGENGRARRSWRIAGGEGEIACLLAGELDSRRPPAAPTPAASRTTDPPFPSAAAPACPMEAGLVFVVEHLDGFASVRVVLDLLIRFVARYRGLPAGAPVAIVTAGAMPVRESDFRIDAGAAALWGFARSLHSEEPDRRLACFDLSARPDWREIGRLADELEAEDGECRIALRGDRRFVPRLQRGFPVPGAPVPALPEGGSCFLAVFPGGGPAGVHFEAEPRRQPGPGEVEVRVQAAALNFRDIQASLGSRSGERERLGFECAGEVASTGPGVDGYTPGRPVIACGAPGALGRYVLARQELVRPRPKGWSRERAAAVSTAYLAAVCALQRLAGLQRGERVLLHTAAGGVGFAALQVAKRLGAEVWATAGTPEKRELLLQWGAHRIFSSRDTGFHREIALLPERERMDVVVNSLSGDAVSLSLQSLAPGGRFVELGDSEILGEDQVRSLHPTARYLVLDLAEETRTRPLETGAVLAEILRDLEAGRLPLPPVEVFDLEEAPAAFAWMAQARHTGKVVLSAARVERRERLRARGLVPDGGSCLITGGLGGVGLLLAEWLAGQGARRLLLMGRRLPSPEAENTVRRLLEKGVDVQVVRGDVTRAEDVQAAVRTADVPGGQLRGVFHLAGASNVFLADRLDPEPIRDVLAPKLTGAWLLDRATRGLELDHFVLFSSAAGLFGSPGLAAFSAAGAFLDSLAWQRRRRGLPALCVDWGLWSGVGLAADANRIRGLRGHGVEGLEAGSAFAALALAMRSATTQCCVMAMQWDDFLAGRPGVPDPFLADVTAGTEGAGPASPASGVLPQDAAEDIPP